uniref:Cathepsin propeptide inhibitor domain-containing protein n=1 Tax=Ditylenchus dipsaci TaxID=166011 RepID=A0A915DNE1_9BILA
MSLLIFCFCSGFSSSCYIKEHFKRFFDTSTNTKIYWEQFKLKYGKNVSLEEEIERKAAFDAAQELIEKHNQKHVQGLVHFRLKTNNLADMPFEKYRNRNNYKHVKKNKESVLRKKDKLLKIVMTKMTMETVGKFLIMWIGEIKATSLKSKCREIVDAAGLSAAWGTRSSIQKREPNAGCNGGNMDSAFEYVRQHGGLATEEKYPFEEQVCAH